MCKSFDKAKEVIQEFIDKGKPFGFEEVQDRILKEKGVLRVAPGVTISDYLDEFEEDNIIYYGKSTGKYYFVAEAEKRRQARLSKYVV